MLSSNLLKCSQTSERFFCFTDTFYISFQINSCSQVKIQTFAYPRKTDWNVPAHVTGTIKHKSIKNLDLRQFFGIILKSNRLSKDQMALYLWQFLAVSAEQVLEFLCICWTLYLRHLQLWSSLLCTSYWSLWDSENIQASTCLEVLQV